MDWQKLIFEVVGGLALFLYGISLISSGLQKAFGQKAAKFLEKITGHPLKGVAVGAGITMVFQSSSITMVTLVGLVNAGLLNLRQSIGVMMGADIGTTITAQLVAFKISKYALPIVAIGAIMLFATKNKYVKYAGQTALGFGILFLGMAFMQAGVKPLGNLPEVKDMLVSFAQTPIYGVIAMAIFTAAVQSSSASTGLVIAMSMEGLIGVEAAIPMILGANIGTTITGVLASIGSTKTAKRTALAQVIYNITGVALFLAFLPWFIDFVKTTADNIPRQIANAHTIFNVGSAVIGIPFITGIAMAVQRIIPGKDIRSEIGLKYINKDLINSPSIAILQSKKEVRRMAKIVKSMIEDFKELLISYDKNKHQEILKKEETVDFLYIEIDNFLVLLSQKSLSALDSRDMSNIMHIISDLERVGDHVKNISGFVKKKHKNKIVISKSGEKDLLEMVTKVRIIFVKSIKFLKKSTEEDLDEIKRLEEEIDYMEKTLKNRHVERIENGYCDPNSNIFFIDMIRNLERIGDHSNNIAHTMYLGQNTDVDEE